MGPTEKMAAAALTAVIIFSSSIVTAEAMKLFPEVEVTLANDGVYPVWYMCQMTQKGDSLYELAPGSTYRFKFKHVAFPMRWCYLYVDPASHGFFWAYSVRSRCTKCFWRITNYPSLYRNDIGRWERQRLFMPPGFNISQFIVHPPPQIHYNT